MTLLAIIIVAFIIVAFILVHIKTYFQRKQIWEIIEETRAEDEGAAKIMERCMKDNPWYSTWYDGTWMNDMMEYLYGDEENKQEGE